MSFLLRIVVCHELSFNNRNLSVAWLGQTRLQFLSDNYNLTSIIQLLHEVPSLQPSHPGNVNVVHKQDFVTNFQNAILISSTT